MLAASHDLSSCPGEIGKASEPKEIFHSKKRAPICIGYRKMRVKWFKIYNLSSKLVYRYAILIIYYYFYTNET